MFRHRPYDFQGGGGLGLFRKKILSLIFVKKINLASIWSENNYLADILPIGKKYNMAQINFLVFTL